MPKHGWCLAWVSNGMSSCHMSHCYIRYCAGSRRSINEVIIYLTAGEITRRTSALWDFWNHSDGGKNGGYYTSLVATRWEHSKCKMSSTWSREKGWAMLGDNTEYIQWNTKWRKATKENRLGCEFTGVACFVEILEYMWCGPSHIS